MKMAGEGFPRPFFKALSSIWESVLKREIPNLEEKGGVTDG